MSLVGSSGGRAFCAKSTGSEPLRSGQDGGQSPCLQRCLSAVNESGGAERHVFCFLSSISRTQAQFSPGCLDQHLESYCVTDLRHTSLSNLGNSDGFSFSIEKQ